MAAEFPPVIGIAGRKRAGKDTTADRLVQIAIHQGLLVSRISFADPIRRGIDAMLGVDMSPEKDRESPVFMGRSRRHLMQTIGTEWGRNLVHPDLWVEIARRHIETLQDWGDELIVIPDVRMPNEAEMIHGVGGKIWLVDNDRLPPNEDAHASEVPLPAAMIDHVVGNHGSFEDLDKTIEEILGRH